MEKEKIIRKADEILKDMSASGFSWEEVNDLIFELRNLYKEKLASYHNELDKRQFD